MKVVFRASDIGLSPAFDMGAFKAIEEGIITSANIMLDGISAKEALIELKKYPWVSLEWHRNLWEKPVLPPEEVPSMVDENGNFKWGHNKWSTLNDTVTYEDAKKEFIAEVEMCKTYANKLPATSWTYWFDKNEMERAYMDVCKMYGIKVNPYKHHTLPINKEFANKEYYMVVLHPDMINPEQKHGYNMEYFEQYHPIDLFFQYPFEKGKDYMVAMHPGFVDDHVDKTSSMKLHRVREYEFAMSDEIKKWVINNKVEMVNQKDIVFGTNDYQEHLKEINSPLYIEK